MSGLHLKTELACSHVISKNVAVDARVHGRRKQLRPQNCTWFFKFGSADDALRACNAREISLDTGTH
jgi:hypothetical protein